MMTMISRRTFSFLKNVLIFLIGRLYKEWQYVFGNGRCYSEGASERGDLYAKQFLENIIYERAGKYDPYVVDGKSAISWGIISVILGKVHVAGLSTLHQTNICVLTKEGDKLFINANLGAGPITYHRNIVFKVGDMEQKASVLASLIDIKASIDFSVEKETGRRGVLRKFAVNELKGFKLRINGFGYFDWPINLFLSFWTLVLGRIVINLLENELVKCILYGLPEYRFPVEDVSYRSGIKFNIPHGSIQNEETSLAEAFNLKRNHEKAKGSRLSPVVKSDVHELRKGYHSMEYKTTKEFESSSETIEISRPILQTSKWIFERNSLPVQSSYLGSGSSNEDSCDGVLTDESEEMCCSISALMEETLDMSRSVSKILQDIDSISHELNFPSYEKTKRNNFKILQDGDSLPDRSIPDEWDDIPDAESNDSESAASATSPPARSLQNMAFLMCGRRENLKSKMEDCSQIFCVSNKAIVEQATEDLNENTRQSKLLKENFSETRVCTSIKNIDEHTLDMEMKLPTCSDNYYLPLSTKEEFSQIDENIPELEAEQSRAETETLDPIMNFNLNRAQMYRDKKFFEEVSDGLKGRIEESNENEHVSVENWKHCQFPEGNDAPNPCKVEELARDPKFFTNMFWQENKSLIEVSESTTYCTQMLSGNQGLETSEILRISDSDDELDTEIRLKSSIVSDLTDPEIIKDEKSFEEETKIGPVSTSPQFSGKNLEENENLLKYIDIGEDGLKKDSVHKAGFILDNSGKSENLNKSNFLDKNVIHNNLREKLACLLNESDTECPDCVVEFSSVAGLKSNADSRKSDLAETPDLIALNVLQNEIIAKTRKLKSDVVLESDSEDSECSGSFPVLSYKKLEYETEGLGRNMVKRLPNK